MAGQRRRAIRVSPERHTRRCTICHSPYREEIEAAYIAWEAPAAICKSFRLSKSTIYLHAQAFGLVEQRDRNIKKALSSLIERNLGRKLSGSALISAISTLAKLDESGRQVEKFEHRDELSRFDGWTRGELQRFVEEGIWPESLAAQQS
jgi:hypothetical protein